MTESIYYVPETTGAWQSGDEPARDRDENSTVLGDPTMAGEIIDVPFD